MCTHCVSINNPSGLRLLAKWLAVPFKGVGKEEERNGFRKREGPNSELFYPVRSLMISGRREVSNFELSPVPPVFLNVLFFLKFDESTPNFSK